MSRLVRRWALVLVSACLCLAIFFHLHDYKLRIFDIWPRSERTSLKPLQWQMRQEIYPLTSFAALPMDDAKAIPTIQAVSRGESDEQKKTRLERRQAVKDATVKSWKAYRKYAWLQDEVTPLSAGSRQTFGGWGATLVDSLDTLKIMGMETEFEEAVAALKQIDFTRAGHSMLNVFETSIRYLGGLLSAYDLSSGQHPELLEKASELGNMLYNAFDTPNRMPLTRWYWVK